MNRPWATMKHEDRVELRRKANENYYAWLPNYVKLKEHFFVETKYLASGKAVTVPKGGVICHRSRN